VKFLPLVWANLKRKKVRTAFTLLSIAVSFFLFGLIQTFKTSLSAGVEVAGNDRLIVIHKVSIIQPLPASYGPRIAQIPGVDAVTHANWFGGIYQDPKNFFPQYAVEPEKYLDLYPEILLPADQKKAWLADRTGAVVGRTTAERFGWKVGDRIPIQGTIFRKQDGTDIWEFNLDGIYDGAKKGTDTTTFLFDYDYLDEARRFARGTVGWYIIHIADPDKAADVAAAIDATFANSPYETKTATEKAFAKSFADQMGNIGAIAVAVAGMVFFAMLLVAGNTMAQAVRERTNELAVLKTLGFKDGRVLRLVLAESFTLAVVGGGLGLLAAWLFTLRGDPTGGMLASFYLPAIDIVWGAAFIVLLGLITGVFPGVQAMRLQIAEALRRV
jgi:putative ABC transport system permease protein